MTGKSITLYALQMSCLPNNFLADSSFNVTVNSRNCNNVFRLQCTLYSKCTILKLIGFKLFEYINCYSLTSMLLIKFYMLVQETNSSIYPKHNLSTTIIQWWKHHI